MGPIFQAHLYIVCFLPSTNQHTLHFLLEQNQGLPSLFLYPISPPPAIGQFKLVFANYTETMRDKSGFIFM